MTDTIRKLISDTDIRTDLGGLTRMTLWRWDRSPLMHELSWPPPQLINHRRYRDARQYEAFRGRMARQAVARRSMIFKQPTEEEDAATA